MFRSRTGNAITEAARCVMFCFMKYGLISPNFLHAELL